MWLLYLVSICESIQGGQGQDLSGSLLSPLSVQGIRRRAYEAWFEVECVYIFLFSLLSDGVA